MSSQQRRWLLMGVLACWMAQRVVGFQAALSPSTPPPTGVITGRVVDKNGQPAVGVRVQAVTRRKRWSGPYYETAVGRPDEADDRGEFRLHSLPPGQYVVAVSIPQPSPGSGPQPQTDNGPEYLRTFNPGTTSLENAEPISVASAQEQSVSITLTPTRLFSVSGTATTSDGSPAAGFDVWVRGGPATVGFTGVRGGFMTTLIASIRTKPDGSFTLSRVPPGAYTLAVTNGYTRRGQPLQLAEVPLEVTDMPFDGIRVVTAKGATVSGQLVWADSGPAPWPIDAQTVGRLRASGVGIESDFGSIDSEIKPDGSFQFTNLYGPRRIQAMALGFNWAIQSVEAPGNVMVGPNLIVTPGRDITGVKVLITKRVGKVSGSVADGSGDASARQSVLLMPANPTDLDPMGWGFRATDAYLVNGDRHYEIERILPGSYLLVAIDVEPYRLTHDAELMERARAAATKIEVREGGTGAFLRLVRLRPFVKDSPR